MTARQADAIRCVFLQHRRARAHRLGRSPAAGKSSRLLAGRPCRRWWRVSSAFWSHHARPLQAPMVVSGKQEQELHPGGMSALLKAAAPAPCAHWAPTLGMESGTGCSPPRRGHLCSKGSPPQAPHSAATQTAVPSCHSENLQQSTRVCGQRRGERRGKIIRKCHRSILKHVVYIRLTLL